MDLSLKPSTSADASYNFDNMEKDSKITIPSNSSASGVAVESVTCMVGKKERQLGRVYMNANGVYTEFVCVKSVSYKPGDSVYLESSCRRDPFEPYNIGTIQEFYRNKRDQCLYVRVKGFLRLTDVRIPEGEYQRYIVQDRNNATNSTGGEGLLCAIQSRELVAADSNTCDIYPVSALRGLNDVHHYRDINAAKDFVSKSDSFFYIFGYNSKSGLAPPQGEIRVGAKHQAKLPECQPDMAVDLMPERNPEECLWRPKTLNYHLSAYVMAVRSMCAYRSICYSNYQENEITFLCKDEATQKAFDSLYKHDYKIDEALHALMKAPQQEQKKWSEEDTKTFVKGLRKYEKNFFRMRKELLPHRTTAELIEFYYLWKKTPSAVKLMKSVRKQTSRRPTNLVRRMRGRPNRSLSSDFVDLNPSDEDEERESEDSDKDLVSYQCTNCNATESKDWHSTTNKSAILCNDCRMFFKKYGELRPIEDKEGGSGSALKPIPEDENNENAGENSGPEGKAGPSTRRGVGRPKSGNSSPDALSGEKGQRSPGNSGSAESRGKKPRGKASTSSACKTEPTTPEPTAPVSICGRKRRKTNASETPSDSSLHECDVSAMDDALVLPGETELPNDKPTDSAFLSSPTSSIPNEPIDARIAFSRLHIKSDPGSSLDGPVRSPIFVKSPKNDATLSLIKSEKPETIPVGVVHPMPASGTPIFPVNFPRAESVPVKPIKTEKTELDRALNDPVKSEPIVPCVPDIERDAVSPVDVVPDAKVAEPKADHAEVRPIHGRGEDGTKKREGEWTGKLIRIWNRGEFNSCARTDHSFVPSPDSPWAKKREQAMRSGGSSSSPSKSQIKSPLPKTEDKRPSGSSQSSSADRDRDNSSVTVVPGPLGSGPRIADTPPRMSIPPRHLGLSPHGPESGLPLGLSHPGMQMYGQMSPGMLHEQQQQNFLRQMERERLMRSGSVPPNMIPGLIGGPGPTSMQEAHMMEMQRRAVQAAASNSMHSLMSLYPPQQAAMMMQEQQQREREAVERALVSNMLQQPHGGPGMHGLHPDIASAMAAAQNEQQQMALYQHLMAGAVNPFARQPFGGSHPGAPGNDMMHPYGRIEQEWAQAAAAASQQAQMQRHMEQAQAEQAQAARMQQMMMGAHPHHDFMRMGGGG